MVNMDNGQMRFKEQVGIVTSEATIDQFKFFVTPLINSVGVEKEDFVMVDHPFLGESCPILAVVNELRNYEEIVGTTIRENRTVKTIAVGEIIGCVDVREPQLKFLNEIAVPPKPGSRVYLPYLEFLNDVFSRTYDGKPFEYPIHLGELKSNANSKDGGRKPLQFTLNSTDFAKHHILLSAISGSGKTHATTIIVEEIVNRTGSPVVIFDPYSEYTTVGIPGKLFNELSAEGKLSLSDYPYNFEVSVYAFNDKGLIKKLERGGIYPRAVNNLKIQPFPNQVAKNSKTQFKIITDDFKEVVKHNRVTVLDSRGMPQEDTRQFFTSTLQALWHYRLDEQVEPFLLVVEEASQLEVEMLRRVASEGRRMGITMCLLTQHPTEIDGKVLSQMGTYMIGRTTDTMDLEYFKSITADNSPLLPYLRPGEWIVNGANLNRPIKVVARERYSIKLAS